jgi:hypothetical protein
VLVIGRAPNSSNGMLEDAFLLKRGPDLLLQDNFIRLDVACILVVLIQDRDGGLSAALQEDHVDYIELVNAHVECLMQLALLINWNDLHTALLSVMITSHCIAIA